MGLTSGLRGTTGRLCRQSRPRGFDRGRRSPTRGASFPLGRKSFEHSPCRFALAVGNCGTLRCWESQLPQGREQLEPGEVGAVSGGISAQQPVPATAAWRPCRSPRRRFRSNPLSAASRIQFTISPSAPGRTPSPATGDEGSCCRAATGSRSPPKADRNRGRRQVEVGQGRSLGAPAAQVVEGNLAG